MSSLPHRHHTIFLALAASLLALLSTVVAWALVQCIALITNLAFFQRLSFAPTSPAQHQLGAAVIIVPVLGAMVIGFMARYGSKAIRGHGIPEAMEQILVNRSRIPARITILKPLSAALSIGTGGPFGAEGPIIATGGALGSLVGQLFSVTATERKTLLAAGAVAGMTAIFGTPLAAVLLAIELLLFEFSARTIVPVGLACATASAARLWFFSSEPIFAMAPVASPTPALLLCFVALGAVVGVAATVITRGVYWVEEQFERLPIHWMWWPALGAIGVGIIGYFAPRTLGVGYENIEQIVAETLPVPIIAWLCGLKLLSWLIALGSGTSGGTLAPLLTLGSGLGAVLAAGLNHAFPALHLPVGLAALVGMAALFAGASRALLASVVFAFETTLQPHALPALLAGATAAFLVANLLARHSIMTEKIARRGVLVPHTYDPDPLAHTTVAQVMSSEWQTLPPDCTVHQLAGAMATHDPAYTRRNAFLVVDAHGHLSGILTRSDLVRALQQGKAQTVAQAATREVLVAYPGETVRMALQPMQQHHIGRLPVVAAEAPTRVLGYLGRAEVLRLEITEVREPGLLQSLFLRPQTSTITA